VNERGRRLCVVKIACYMLRNASVRVSWDDIITGG